MEMLNLQISFRQMASLMSTTTFSWVLALKKSAVNLVLLEKLKMNTPSSLTKELDLLKNQVF